MASLCCAKTAASRDETHLSFGIWCVYIRYFTVVGLAQGGSHRIGRKATEGGSFSYFCYWIYTSAKLKRNDNPLPYKNKNTFFHKVFRYINAYLNATQGANLLLCINTSIQHFPVCKIVTYFDIYRIYGVVLISVWSQEDLPYWILSRYNIYFVVNDLPNIIQ